MEQTKSVGIKDISFHDYSSDAHLLYIYAGVFISAIADLLIMPHVSYCFPEFLCVSHTVSLQFCVKMALGSG